MNTVRVIVDTRNGAHDRKLQQDVVAERYKLGHLVLDCTNGLYAVPENGKVPSWMLSYPQVR